MGELPPEDRPDVIHIGSVHDIPIIDADDPRFEEDRKAWSAANKAAQAMWSADDLLAGLTDGDWRVRCAVVPRLVARAKADDRTEFSLRRALRDDPAWEVRDAVAMALREFDSEETLGALRQARNDPSEEVRWSAEFVLAQRDA